MTDGSGCPKNQGRCSDLRSRDSGETNATTTSRSDTRPTATSSPATWRHVTRRSSATTAIGVHGRRQSGPSTSTSRTPSPRKGTRSSPSDTATSSRCTRTSRRSRPTTRPFRIYPAVHYVMGGLWVDYNLMTNIPGLYAIGEANFSDHGANRLGASSMMQCLADGYFILPQTIGDYLHDIFQDKVTTDHPAFAEHEQDVT